MEKDRIILKKRFDALIETMKWIKKQNTFELEKTSYLQRNTIKSMLTNIYKNGLSNKTGDIYFEIWITDNFNIQIEFPSDFGSEELKNDFFNIFAVSECSCFDFSNISNNFYCFKAFWNANQISKR